MKSTRQIDIYLTKKLNVRTIDVVQYDTGIHLVFSVKDFTIPSGAIAKMYVQKPSGKFVFQEDGITVTDNTITVDLENQAITEHGKVPYQVSIINGSDMITAFTGLMMVEKSLKDSGATESKTVIRAFDEAVSDHVADFRSKAEQIVQACIATIPSDYTVMEAKINELASVVKGCLSGAVVAADDVSPVQHSPVVRVHGKNLFNYTQIDFENRDLTMVDNGDGSITVNAPVGSSAVSTKATLRQLAPTLKEGKLYTLSFDSNGTDKYIYLSESKSGWNNRTARIINESDLASTVFLYASGVNTTATISNIQIEQGETATGYEPYIDPANVTVSRHGKNLACSKYAYTVEQKGLTITGVKNSSEVILDGTSEQAQSYKIMKDLVLQPGTYTAQIFNANVMDAASDRIYIWDQASQTVIQNYIMTGKPQTFTVEKTVTVGVEMVFAAGTAYSNKAVKVQIEAGSKATGYEKYAEPITRTPAADGTVAGVTSLSPYMTILTDTEGVTVECEYNIDTKTYIDNKIAALLSNKN